MPTELENAYRHCRQVAFGHYENFPVASLLLPAAQRDSIAAIYAFARRADDFADEVEFSGRRLENLDAWEKGLREPGSNPVMIALEDTRRRHRLEESLFTDLLDAFRQDVLWRRYQSRDQVLDYCRRSANPVGRLVLRVFGESGPQEDAWSDQICTALQLANFWQDLGLDFRDRDRIYLPKEDMDRHGVVESMFRAEQSSAALRNCVREWVRLTETMFLAGAPLVERLPGRLGLEIRLTIQGGMEILNLVRSQDYDTLRRRPALTKKDWFRLLLTRWRVPQAVAA